MTGEETKKQYSQALKQAIVPVKKAVEDMRRLYLRDPTDFVYGSILHKAEEVLRDMQNRLHESPP